MSVTVDGAFDGGNPQHPWNIRQLGDARFAVYPYSEDGDGNYKFALNVRLRNSGGALPVRFDVHWDHVDADRCFAHITQGRQWTCIAAEVDGPVSHIDFLAPPGESCLGLSPPYGLGDYQRFVAGLPAGAFQRETVGKSAQGRVIECLRAGEGPRRVLVVTRIHPYETAASFCAEGLLASLASSVAQDSVRDFQFAVAAMPNPDGVALGLCKRTGPCGADLSHEGALGADAAAEALLDLAEQFKPHAVLDIHGWMHLDEDGLHPAGGDLEARFRAAAGQTQALRGNVWLTMPERPHPGVLLPYLSERYGAPALALSYRWHAPSRSAEQMRAIGAATLQAFCAAL